MTAGVVTAGNLSDTYRLIPLLRQNVDRVLRPSQLSECVLVRGSISCGCTEESFHLSTELHLRAGGTPPLKELPSLLLRLVVRRKDHGCASYDTVGTVKVGISILIRLLQTRDQGEVPKSSDFGSGYHQGVVHAVVCNCDRHLTGTETARKVVHRRATIVVVEFHVLVECVHAGFIIYDGLGSLLIIEVTAILEQHREVQVQVTAATGRCSTCSTRHTNVHVVTLDGREHLNEFLPGIRYVQLQLFQDVLTIEQYVEGLGLRHAVNGAVERVLRVGTGSEVGEHFLESVELRQVNRRTTERVVNGLVAADGKKHVRTSACHNCIQHGCSLYRLHVYLDAGLRSELFVNQCLHDGTLVTTGQHPNLEGLLSALCILVINVADCFIIYKEGSEEGLDLVTGLLKEACLVLFHLGIHAGYADVVNVKLDLAQLQDGGTKCGNVILEVRELRRDLLRLLHKSLELRCQRLCGSDLACLLSGNGNHVIHGLVKALCLKLHCKDGVRVYLLDLIISVLVGGCAGINKDLSIDLVQAEGTILKLFQNGTYFAEGCLKTQGVRAGGQVELVRAILVAEGLALPVILIIKGNLFYFFKRNLSVNGQHSAGHGAARVVLAALDGDVIISGLRNGNVPLDPLTCGLPCVAAGIVQDRLGNAVRAGRRGRTIIFCIQGRLRTTYGVLALEHFIKGKAYAAGICCGKGCRIFRIALYVLNGCKLYASENHGLVDCLEAELSGTLLEIEHVRLSYVAHAVLTVCALPVIDLDLGRTDLVALVVHSLFAAVSPNTAEYHVSGVIKRKLAVNPEGALCSNTSGLRKQILYVDVVKAALRNVYLPGNNRVSLGQKCLTFAAVIAYDFHLSLSGIVIKTHHHVVLRRAGARMISQVPTVRTGTLCAGNVNVKVGTFIFLMKVLGSPEIQEQA